MATFYHPLSVLITEKKIYFNLVLILFYNFSFAQETAKNTEPSPLEELNGFTQTYYYSPGHKERAKDIAKFLEEAGDYFQEEVSFIPEIELYVLAPHHWKDVAVKLRHDV